MVIKSTDDNRLVRKTRFSAGYDVLLDRDVDINPGVNYIDLNLKLDILIGSFVETYTRSSTLKKFKTLILNSIIDSDYKGSIHLICWSFNEDKITLKKGESICQLVVHNQTTVDNWTNLENDRKGGLGSTDIKENK
jgi:dUTPase